VTIAEKLARKEVVAMVPYQSARRLFSMADSAKDTKTSKGESQSAQARSKVWLNANEASGAGNYQINSDCINRYPDFQPDNLINAYSAYTGLAADNILATRGADEGIELLIRTFCTAYQDNILICPPTYGMYAISAENHGASIVKVPLINNGLNLASMTKQVGKVKVVFLCSPGNPTGNLLPQEEIKAAVELFKDSAIVVVDEAYIEFCHDKTVINWLAEYPHLVVLRTLSKAFALAGLRCGFTLASSEIITLLAKVIAPYPVSAPVAEIASSALSIQGLQQVNIRVQENNILREQLAIWLNEQTWCVEVFASDANFILFRVESLVQKDFIFSSLEQQGILIRDQSKQVQLENCLRISIGSERELSLLKQTIVTAIAEKLTEEK